MGSNITLFTLEFFLMPKSYFMCETYIETANVFYILAVGILSILFFYSILSISYFIFEKFDFTFDNATLQKSDNIVKSLSNGTINNQCTSSIKYGHDLLHMYEIERDQHSRSVCLFCVIRYFAVRQ